MTTSNSPCISRRNLLLSGSASLLFFTASNAGATIIKGVAPWKPFDYSPPETLGPGGWFFFTPSEGITMEALVDCLIPPDELSAGGKDAGCAEFIDRQLAGSFGTAERLYMQGPFIAPTPMQGDQSPLVPRDRYRHGLAALDDYCAQKFQKPFAALSADDQRAILKGLEKADIKLKDFDSKLFFSTLLQNTMEGFFSDPIYGGNREMVSWKMLGFPGARYDYRDYIDLHNQKLDLPPLSIAGRPEWKQRG